MFVFVLFLFLFVSLQECSVCFNSSANNSTACLKSVVAGLILYIYIFYESECRVDMFVPSLLISGGKRMVTEASTSPARPDVQANERNP